MLKKMKKTLLLGLICELLFALCAVGVLIAAAFLNAPGLVVASAIVIAALIYTAVGFIVENASPRTK